MSKRLTVKPMRRYPSNAYIGLSVPTELKRRMAKIERINWSRLFQAAVRRRLNELERA